MLTEKKIIIKDSGMDPVKTSVRKYQNLPVEKWSNFIEAGSGNYEKFPENGKYRHSYLTL